MDSLIICSLPRSERSTNSSIPDMPSSLRLFLVTLAVICAVASASNSYRYSMEYQFQLDTDLFDDRETGIEMYLNTWSNIANMPLANLSSPYETIRTEQKFVPNDCGIDITLRKRTYIWGDLEGLVTLDLKSTDELSRDEAEDESYETTSAYTDRSDRQIELDVFPCSEDYASDTRIYLDEEPAIDTCGDIAKFYQFNLKESSKSIEFPDADGVTYNYFVNGTFLDAPIKLAFTMFYPTGNDAVKHKNFEGGELSLTVFSSDDGYGEYSEEQLREYERIYTTMLDSVGSVGDYPCDDEEDASSSATQLALHIVLPISVLLLAIL